MIKMLSTLVAAFGVFLGLLLASSAYERATPSALSYRPGKSHA